MVAPASIAIIACGLLVGGIRGFNYGIDFRGGTSIRTDSSVPVDVGAYREGGDVAFDVELGYPAKSQIPALRKALIDSRLGEDLTGSGYNDSIRQHTFAVGMKDLLLQLGRGLALDRGRVEVPGVDDDPRHERVREQLGHLGGLAAGLGEGVEQCDLDGFLDGHGAVELDHGHPVGVRREHLGQPPDDDLEVVDDGDAQHPDMVGRGAPRPVALLSDRAPRGMMDTEGEGGHLRHRPLAFSQGGTPTVNTASDAASTDSPRIWGGTTLATRRAARREKLVEVGLELLGTPGSTLSVRAACRSAQLTERYFYESFPDRDALVLAVYQQVADEVRTDRHGNVYAARNPAGSPRVMLAGHCDQIALMVQHHPHRTGPDLS